MWRERVFWDRRSPLEVFDDAALRKRYRFSRQGIMNITDLSAPNIEHPTKRNYALLPDQQVSIALQHYATGTFHMVVGDPLQVSQPTAFRALHRVTNALCRRIHDCLKLPDENTLPQIKDGFYQLRGFPGVIGLIDETHTWIVSHGENEGTLNPFLCHKAPSLFPGRKSVHNQVFFLESL